MNVFNLLKKEIRKCLEILGIKEPTEIQRVAIPKILSGRNVILSSPVGSGKTEAALLPIFNKFLELKPEPISILYITPLRALNRDLLDRLKVYSERLNINIQVRHGDTSKYIRRKQVKHPMDMLITTPETLQAIIVGKKLRTYLKNVKFVIIDEIHELINSKRGCLLISTLERLNEIASFQRICLSATVSDEELFLNYFKCDEVVKVDYLKEFDIKVERPAPKRGDEEISKIISSNIDVATKIRRISEILDKNKSCLIFSNTRDTAELLLFRMKKIREDVELHHGSLSKEIREEVEKKLKENKIKGLVCTSSLELGIDIGSIDFIIQYNSPRQVVKMVQRIGRSGHRIGEKAKGLIISTDTDELYESLSIMQLMHSGFLEKPEVYEKPYDILAIQMVGLVLDFGEINKEKMYRILKKCYVFRNLTKEEFEEVLNFLVDMKLLRIKDDMIYKTKKSWKFYYENLSVIPDEKKFEAIDILSRRKIGYLDESFIIRLNEGDNIILNGRIWKISKIDTDKIYLEQVFSNEAIVPSWVGEEIPVSYEVSKNVLNIIKNLDKFELDDITKKFLKAKILKQRNLGFFIPQENEIHIEIKKNQAIIHTYMGTKLNNTLAFIFKIILGANVYFDPYRILITLRRNVEEIDIRRVFHCNVEKIFNDNIYKEDTFKWKFLHVARRLWILPKDVSYKNIGLDKIIEVYKDSFIYREALKETLRDYFDLNRMKKIFDDIRHGKIKLYIHNVEDFSPLAKNILQKSYELYKSDENLTDIVKRRLLEKKLTLFCLYCKKWKVTLRLVTIYKIENLRCDVCNSRMLAILKDESDLNLFSKKKLDRKEKRKLERIRDSAILFMNYGKRACLVLAGYGIGVETAKKILRESWSEEELIRKIIEAEKFFIKTRKFWD